MSVKHLPSGIPRQSVQRSPDFSYKCQFWTGSLLEGISHRRPHRKKNNPFPTSSLSFLFCLILYYMRQKSSLWVLCRFGVSLLVPSFSSLSHTSPSLHFTSFLSLSPTSTHTDRQKHYTHKHFGRQTSHRYYVWLFITVCHHKLQVFMFALCSVQMLVTNQKYN